MNLSCILAGEGLCKLDRIGDGLVWMTGCQQRIRLACAIAHNKLVNDVLNPRAVMANDTNKRHSIAHELRDESINTGLITSRTMQHDFLSV